MTDAMRFLTVWTILLLAAITDVVALWKLRRKQPGLRTFAALFAGIMFLMALPFIAALFGCLYV